MKINPISISCTLKSKEVVGHNPKKAVVLLVYISFIYKFCKALLDSEEAALYKTTFNKVFNIIIIYDEVE